MVKLGDFYLTKSMITYEINKIMTTLFEVLLRDDLKQQVLTYGTYLNGNYTLTNLVITKLHIIL